MCFLGQYQIPWIWQWSFTVANRHRLYIIVWDLYYKWWTKFQYLDIIKEISKDIQTYVEYNYYVEQEQKAQRISNLENQEFKTPTLASLKQKFPNASTQELKKKMLMTLASQLDELKDEDVMSTSSKSHAPSAKWDNPNKNNSEDAEIEEEKETELNEDIDNYMGIWLENLYATKMPDNEDKGKRQVE